jgi:small-conductance mechanosensitive channel
MTTTSVPDLLLDLAIRYGFQVLGAIVILIAGFTVAWWVGRMVERPLERWALEPPMRRLMVRVVRVVVLAIGVSQLELAGVRMAVSPWVRVPDVVVAEAELYRALSDRFVAAGVAVPLPKQEVRVLMGS